MDAGRPVHSGEMALDETCSKVEARFRVRLREGTYGIQIPKMAWHMIEVQEPSSFFEGKDGGWAAGVEARPPWKPKHKQPVYKNAPACVIGVSESLFKTGMCVPSGLCETGGEEGWSVLPLVGQEFADAHSLLCRNLSGAKRRREIKITRQITRVINRAV